ncbi:Synapse-associated protein 1 [Clonorchis sinensis]|uniref:Synapse-associated protein 1 n=1 Tax=Clonorchis sinensis TaxID=79923 RepID=A0A8T1N1R9_CLOSI|nr:Synapse-associated protein 1 [Clonorchis sinensis]
MGLSSQSEPTLKDDKKAPDKKDTTEYSADTSSFTLPAQGDEATHIDGITALQDGFRSARNWSAQIYKKVLASSETTARAVAEKVKLEEVGANVRQLINQVPLIREFQRSQAEFEAAHTSDVGDVQSTVLPWHPDVSGLTDEAMVEKLKMRILALSKQPNTFLLAPPAEAQIADSFSADNVQLAKALLREDPNLESMRYNLVPKRIREDLFWRNYFYRVSVVRQSFQLSAMSGSAVDDAPDFVCIEESSVWNEPALGELESTDNAPKFPTESDKSTPEKSEKKASGTTHPKASKKRKSKASPATEPDVKVPPTSATSTEMTEEEILEAELAREVDEMVLISSKPGEPDELDRELEMELLAELGQENSS